MIWAICVQISQTLSFFGGSVFPDLHLYMIEDNAATTEIFTHVRIWYLHPYVQIYSFKNLVI